MKPLEKEKPVKEDLKTIKFIVYFHTDGLPAKVVDGLTPMWTCGKVYVEANKTKGIRASATLPFDFVEEIPEKFIQLMAINKLAPITHYRVKRKK